VPAKAESPPLKFDPLILKERVAIALWKAAARHMHQMEQVLKPYDLTPTQFNALRIINGASPVGICGTEVSRRLISPVPDVTRLLDRIEEAGLIARERDPENRRFVAARITEAGKLLLARTAPIVTEMHRRHFAALSDSQSETLLQLLALS
jgi:DNA-binding MarR family transcriptional regulator